LTKKILKTLHRRNKRNVLLIGENGVGKRSLVNGIAQEIEASKWNHSDRLSSFDDVEIFEIDLEAITLNPPTKGKEEALEKIIEEIKKHSQTQGRQSVILIKNIHMLLQSIYPHTYHAPDLLDILDSLSKDPKTSIIATITPAGYRKVLKSNTVTHDIFSKIDVPEPSPDELKEILDIHRESLQRYHNCLIPDETIEIIMDKGSTRGSSIAMPGRAIDILDEACATLDIMDENDITYAVSPNPEDDLKGVGVITPDILKDTTTPQDKKKKPSQAIKKKTARDLEPNLKQVVFDQDEAIKAVSKSLRRAAAGLNEEDKPLGSFFFKGPTGVGKTELAKQLANRLEAKLVRIDMSEYAEKHTVSRLVGSPPGYIGHDAGGQLSGAIPNGKPCVVLLDETEKAHGNVHNILLQIMDDGNLTDGQGKKIDFRNVVLIMTSNVESGGEIKRTISFENQKEYSTKSGDFKKAFPPEFRNRLDAVVEFNDLSHETLLKIVDKLTKELETKLQNSHKMSINITPNAKEWLAKKGFEPSMGARPLKRVFASAVKDPVADKLLDDEHNKLRGSKVVVGLKDDSLTFEFQEKAPAKPKRLSPPRKVLSLPKTNPS
ncbi:MAG: ATP-dependent Clp protease ATP-binding subunit, partial [Alphaproteobacteria bacterium]|nr:ATP-dependent Clp protease ATP-binding subunit [Alphaproteobacteria bacterium]